MSSPVRPPLTVTDGTTEVRPTNKIVFDAADGFSVTKNGNDARIDFTGGGTIGGSIADTQVAFGTAANTIGGDSSFTYDTSTNQLKIVGVSDNVAEFIIERFQGSTQTIGIENDSSVSPIIRVNSPASNVKLMDFRNTIDDTAVTAGNSGFVFHHQISGNTGSVKEFLRMLTTDSSSYEVVFNEDSKNQSFRIESDGNSNMFFLSGSQNNIGIGGTPASTVERLHIKGAGTNAIVKIESSDDSDTSAPDLVLFRNSASPATDDLIGTIDFKAQDAAGNEEYYGRIMSRILDTSATHAGQMLFKVAKNGSVAIANPDIKIQAGTGIIFNEGGFSDMDFRVESDTKTHALFVDAGNNLVGIMAAPSTSVADNNPVLQVDGSTSSKQAIITVTGTSKTLTSSDEMSGQLYVFTSGSAKTLTLPNSCTAGDRLRFVCTGGSGLDVVVAGGATNNGVAAPSSLARDLTNEFYEIVAIADNKYITGNDTT